MDRDNGYTQIETAKRMLIENYGMNELRAERYIQKISVNACVSKAEAAKMIAESLTFGTPKGHDL